MFNKYVRKGLIKSFNWDEYFVYMDEPLFNHEHMDFECVKKYMKIAYRRAILLNPQFILRRLIRGLKNGELVQDAIHALRFALMPETTEKTTTEYYARERWPQWDFLKNQPEARDYQIVGKATTSG